MNRRILVPPALVTALVLALAAGGCSPRATSFVHPNFDFGRLQRCAVLPFQNLSSDANASARLQAVFLAELLRHEGLAVVEPGETVAALRELRLNVEEPLAPAQLQELGRRLQCEGLFLGTVQEYGLDAMGGARTYKVTADFSLVETETGQTIWKAQAHRSGGSIWRKLFGGDSAGLYDVSRGVVRQALETLF